MNIPDELIEQWRERTQLGIGVAILIDDETEEKIIALLNAKRPRNAPADKAGGEKL